MGDNEKETSSIPSLVLEDENNGEPSSSGGSTLYKYRDFSNMPEEPDTEDDNGSSASNNQRGGSLESSIRVQKFPVKLYAILAQKEFHDIITWMPHGRSWKVLKPNLFESMVMPLFFEYSNYHSFNRLVNAWSFRRISSGPDRGSYYHELFLRGKPHLQKYMRRLPKTHKKLPMKKEDEPDFYKLDKENPLPPLEEIPLSTQKMRANNGPGLGGAAQGMSMMNQQRAAAGGMHHHQMQMGMGGGGGRGMFSPEGVGSHDSYDGPDAYGSNSMGMGLRNQTRSPTANSPLPASMRDPTNFKNMEFKPATGMDSMHHPGMAANSMGNGMGMMGGQMGGMNQHHMNHHQMGGQMMGGMMGGPQMGMNNGMMNNMNNGMMGGPQMGMNNGMMNNMNNGMMGGPQMGMGMNNGMMGGSQMGNGMMNGAGQQMDNSQQFYNLQRLRQAQQMQFLNGPSSMPVGAGGDMGSYRPQC
jgi:hypothetical protein